MLPVHILVVEDEKMTRKLICNMLMNLGHQVVPSASAEEGLEAFEQHAFDVVVSDVNLPGTDGIEMVRRLRAHDPTLVAIIMTSRHDQEIAVRALECGVRSFLVEPFSENELETKLKEALRERNRGLETRHLMGDLIRTRLDLQHKILEQDRQLTQTEHYLYNLIDAAPFAILSSDTTGQILTFNGTAEQLYGYAENEVIGQPVSMLFGKSEAHCNQGKQNHVHKDGTSLSVLTYHRDILDQSNKCIARLDVVEDLTTREQLEEQLIFAERLSLLGQLAPCIAHEFKTPLQIITGYTELILEGLQKGQVEQARSFAELVLPATKQVLDLVKQIANLGKPTKSHQEELDLAEELKKLLDTLQHLGAIKRCRIVQDFAHPLPTIQGDPTQIEQVFRNLIVNAAQAMETSPERELGLGLKLSADGRLVEGVVSDTGPGIPAEHIERIFQPFFTTKPESKGTGLGLSIVKTIVDRHGGTIRVESAEGEGTRFFVSFPASVPS